MAYDGVVEDVRACVECRAPRRIPVCATSEEFDVKWHGAYPYGEIATSADRLVEVWSAAIREFGYDWAWVQVDDCIEFETIGVGCVGSGNILRATHDYLPATRETISSLRLPDPSRDGRMPMKLEAIRRLKAMFGNTVLVVGSNAAPYSSAGLLYGLEAPMLMMYEDPALLRETMAFFVELQRRWGSAQLSAGADAIWLGDCNAFSSMLSPQQYRDFAFDPCKKLIAAYRRAGGITILHNSEQSPAHLELEFQLGADVVSLGPGADLAAAKRMADGRQCIMGNLDPIQVLMKGSPQAIEREVERIMRIGKRGTGWIFNVGEMVPRDVPVENMNAMMRRAKGLAAL